MSRQIGTEYRKELTLEEALRVYASSPEPGVNFVDRLEQMLLQAQRSMDARQEKAPARRRPGQPRRQLRWALAGVAVLLALAAPLLIIGPGQVWAEIQAWLGYIPGVGFVDLEHSRILAGPCAVTRDGVYLSVEQVVAAPDKTTIVLRSEGISPEKEVWPEGMPVDDTFQAKLWLPDGNVLSPESWSLRYGGATLVFPSLPEDVSGATLELSHLPWAPVGEATSSWQVVFTLQPGSGERVVAVYLTPYRPEGASDRHNGVTMTVLEVAHTAEETAVQLQFSWENPEWVNRFGRGEMVLPYLEDPAGHEYWDIPGSASGFQVGMVARPTETGGLAPTLIPNTWTGIETFSPVPTTVETLTLVVEDIGFETPADDSFTIDLGEDPQIGDHWEMDITLNVAGFPVHLTGAHLVEEEVQLRDSRWQRTLLAFDLEPVAPEENRSLAQFYLATLEAGFTGTTSHGQATEEGYQIGITLAEESPIPSGTILVQVTGARIRVQEPWQVTWAIPTTR